ncbi:uncharacterized protein ARMOST_20062 [Armillaria ostoyae]|uniref:Uncharacterized protein n=1 Tax=Armillaria ostoyae TaxID=47428 RepID=A0A284S6E7_ARMOS|nr:uncharacterized protein ARMOST_20062 [Armillaria ostoyae]
MDVLTKLETTLSMFSPPSSVSPSVEDILVVHLVLHYPNKKTDIVLQKQENIPPKRAPAGKYPDRISTPEKRVDEILSYLRDLYITLQEFCTFVQVDRLPKYEHHKVFNLCKRCDIDQLRGHPAGIATLKQTFKTCHHKDVTSQNHLLNLYRLFGVSILLDPSLEMHTKTGAPTCSNTYMATIDLLQQHLVPFTPALDALDDQNCVFLFNFLCAMGMLSVYNFIKNFVETFDQN